MNSKRQAQALLHVPFPYGNVINVPRKGLDSIRGVCLDWQDTVHRSLYRTLHILIHEQRDALLAGPILFNKMPCTTSCFQAISFCKRSA